MTKRDEPDDRNGTTANGTTRRRFVRSVALVAGALALPGLATAHHDSRSEQGERNGKDSDAHENRNGNNGRGRGRGRNNENGGDDGNDDDGGDGGDGDSNEDVQVTAERRDDGSTFVFPSGPGATLNQVDLVMDASQPVFVRDRFPSDWTVAEGDPHTTYTEGDTRLVEFTERVTEATRTYFVEIPGNIGADEFGPIEYSLDGETWVEVPGTTETNLVVAQGTDL